MFHHILSRGLLFAIKQLEIISTLIYLNCLRKPICQGLVLQSIAWCSLKQQLHAIQIKYPNVPANVTFSVFVCGTVQ